MNYDHTAIGPGDTPRAGAPEFQHLIDTYVGETNKTISVWREFGDADLGYRPHPRSSSVRQILEHQLLSERRFFAEFLGSAEPPPGSVLPGEVGPGGFAGRMEQLARARLAHLASRTVEWWMEEVGFFDSRRTRIWIFWRRVLHSAHHRTQLTVYLRLLDKKVVSTYGPTADVTWAGASPTLTVADAGPR